MKKYAHLLIILALSGLMIFALLRLGHIDFSLETLWRVNGFWLLAGFITFYLSVMMRGLRWQAILNTMGWRVGFVYSQALLITGLFISSILPGRAGDIARVALLKQDHHVPISQGVASIAAERALDVLALLTLATMGAIITLHGRVPPELLELLGGTAILFIIGLVGLFAIPGLESWLRRPGWVWRLVPAKISPLYEKVIEFGLAMIHGVHDLSQKPLALSLMVMESFSIWLLDGVLIYVTLLSLGVTVPFIVSVFAGAIGALATSVPLMPGAMGQFEVAVIGLLILLGVPPAEASLTALLVRFISLWTFIPVSGLITYVFGFSHALSLIGSGGKMAPAPATTPIES